jgi:hypothetical protein
VPDDGASPVGSLLDRAALLEYGQRKFIALIGRLADAAFFESLPLSYTSRLGNIMASSTDAEEIEGIDPAEGSGWGADYPIDSVFVRKEERSIRDVLYRINQHRYQLDPDFQRTFVWKVDKQSKLIESCLMRIPLPVFYVAEAKDGRIIVVDGLQRLTTFQRFVGNKFSLSGLSSGREGDSNRQDHPLEGKWFRDLPLKLQERIEDTPLVFYILDSKAPERARLDIFDRVNSGVALTRQQMRNSLYNGPATRWLSDAAAGQPFLEVTGGALDPLTMRDREVINRFCAFKLLGVAEYQGADIDGFLGRALEKMNGMTKGELADLRNGFDHSMRVNHDLFGRHAFCKSLALGDADARKSPMNIALFDVLSTILTDADLSAARKKRGVVSEIIKLLQDESFSKAITYATTGNKNVSERFSLAKKALAKVL